MRSDKGLYSFSFDREQATRQTTQRMSQDNDLLQQLMQELKTIKRELKGKVSRNQFVSGLSAKLSISEISSLTSLSGRSANENMNTINRAPDGQKLKLELQNFKKQIKDQLQADLQQVKQHIGSLNDVLDRSQQSKCEEKAEAHEQIKIQRQKISELEAYAYRKADRSELDKLFTLNELLVIEIEQAKQQTQQLSKKIKEISTVTDEKINRKEQSITRVHQDQIRIMRQDIKRFEEQVDRVLDLVEQRETQTETYRAKENQCLARCDADIICLRDRVKKIQLQANLQLRDLTTRLSVVELKENQLSRAAKDVDGMRNEIDTIRLDIHNVAEKVEATGIHLEGFCHRIVGEQNSQLQRKVQKQLEVACEEIMRKAIDLTTAFVTSDQFQRQICQIRDGNRKIYDLCLSNSAKINDLSTKVTEVEELIDEEAQKTEERMGKLNNEVEDLVPMRKMRQILKSLVSCEELTQIAKQIDKKVSKELKNIAEEQGRVNQVLCSENIVAKWFWNSGQLKGGNLVAWDKQIVNTLPQNFKWIKGESAVIIVSSGFYQIQLGFYSKKKPTVQVIVNGQTIVSAVNTNSYVVHHSSGKLKDVSNSEICGLTYIDYLLLPEGSRMVISYIGDFTGQGFLCLKRV